MYDSETEDSAVDSTSEEALLLEIRDRFSYAMNAWRDIRDEAKTDRRYLSGDPWDEADRKARADAGRPCINHDELNQYVNQAINQVRQSPPAIKVEPGGAGSSDKSAELAQGIVRGIEYQSDAQSCYMVAFEAALSGSFGWFRLGREYVDDDSDNQHIRVKAIMNPDSVLYDPDCKEPDWSDAHFCFVLDAIPRKEFARRYPGAEKTSFSVEDAQKAPDWIKPDSIIVAEYWKVKITSTKRGKRTVETRSVVQYITNGVEILEELPQPGTMIPIIPVIGKETYVDNGAGPERQLISLVRLARDPQMSMAYLTSLEMEEGGLTPKIPYIGYVGQFETDKDTWSSITKIPHSFAQVDAITDQATGQVLPLPVRTQITPNFQAYEVAKESCRRAIMSAMGIMPLPTAAQRQNEKSGVALKQIQSQQSVGSFHFTANLHRALRMAGRIMLQWIPKVYDTERDIAIAHDDGKREIVKINAQQQEPQANGQPADPRTVGPEAHEVTISVGPSFESQREEASDFLDTLVANLKGLPLAPQQAAKLLALLITMKQLGPKGDQMAEIISPDDQEQMPPQAQQAVAKAQQEAQALNAQCKQLEQEIQKLQMEKQAKVVDNSFKSDLMQMQNEVKVLVAEIQTKAQQENERTALFTDVFKHLTQLQHEKDLASQQHAQQLQQNDQQAQAAQEQQAQASDQQMQAQQQGEEN